jgi:hypothetical protein
MALDEGCLANAAVANKQKLELWDVRVVRSACLQVFFATNGIRGDTHTKGTGEKRGKMAAAKETRRAIISAENRVHEAGSIRLRFVCKHIAVYDHNFDRRGLAWKTCALVHSSHQTDTEYIFRNCEQKELGLVFPWPQGMGETGRPMARD